MKADRLNAKISELRAIQKNLEGSPWEGQTNLYKLVTVLIEDALEERDTES